MSGFAPGSDREKLAKARGVLYSVMFALDGFPGAEEMQELREDVKRVLEETADGAGGGRCG